MGCFRPVGTLNRKDRTWSVETPTRESGDSDQGVWRLRPGRVETPPGRVETRPGRVETPIRESGDTDQGEKCDFLLIQTGLYYIYICIPKEP